MAYVMHVHNNLIDLLSIEDNFGNYVLFLTNKIQELIVPFLPSQQLLFLHFFSQNNLVLCNRSIVFVHWKHRFLGKIFLQFPLNNHGRSNCRFSSPKKN
jgi:hypothetical protein